MKLKSIVLAIGVLAASISLAEAHGHHSHHHWGRHATQASHYRVAGRWGRQHTPATETHQKPFNPVEMVGDAISGVIEGAKAAILGTKTALYDIAAGRVFLPDGRVLEAHSGRGNCYDNPSCAAKKNVGPTPPGRYRLAMREATFHGVKALRLNPEDESKMHGRDGILAHTPMLRGGGAQSQGCVTFLKYQEFLASFQKGQVDEILVVSGSNRDPA